MNELAERHLRRDRARATKLFSGARRARQRGGRSSAARSARGEAGRTSESEEAAHWRFYQSLAGGRRRTARRRARSFSRSFGLRSRLSRIASISFMPAASFFLSSC